MNSGHKSSKSLNEELRRIAGLVANIPEAEAPDTLIDSVMARIQPKKVHPLRLIWRRIRTPMAITPLKIAPLGAAIVAAFLVILLYLMQAPGKHEVVSIFESAKGSKKTVFLTLDMPGASSVDVIGSFNRWTPGALKMRWDESRRLWVLSLQLDRGRYEYAFLIDGKTVVSDPRADFEQDDGFGNRNSVLIIEMNNGNETGI